MILELVTAPTLRPLTLAEAVNFCRVNDSADNALVESLIDAARQKCETLAGRTLLTTTWDLKLRSFPHEISLPMPPVASVTSVTYYDQNGTSQTLTATTDYLTYLGKKSALVFLPNGACWPTTYDRPDAVTVRYVAGWSAVADIPPCLVAWVREAVATLYEHREQMITGTIATELPREFCAGLLDPERIVTA